MGSIICRLKELWNTIKKRMSRVQCTVCWDDKVDPFSLPYKNFRLKRILGYSHTRNHVFHVQGIYQHKRVKAFIKVSDERSVHIKKEIDTTLKLKLDILPQIIDYDDDKEHFVVTIAKNGQKLTNILGSNTDGTSMEYMFEYGKMLACLHKIDGDFDAVTERPYFHIPALAEFEKANLQFVHEYLTNNKPQTTNKCFCHGDFNYANILWQKKRISAVLDFEISGIGNREYDIAWALAVRPGQHFLRTRQEVLLFLDGYRSVGSLNIEYLKYYLVLVYSHLYLLAAKSAVYKKYIINVFCTICFDIA